MCKLLNLLAKLREWYSVILSYYNLVDFSRGGANVAFLYGRARLMSAFIVPCVDFGQECLLMWIFQLQCFLSTTTIHSVDMDWKNVGRSIIFFMDVDWRAYANKNRCFFGQIGAIKRFLDQISINYLIAKCRKYCWGTPRPFSHTVSVHKISSWSWKLSRFAANLIFFWNYSKKCRTFSQKYGTFSQKCWIAGRKARCGSRDGGHIWQFYVFQIRKWRRKTGDGEEQSDTKTRRAPFIFYSRKQMSRDRKRQPADRVFTPQMDSVATSKLMREMWHQLSDAKKAKWARERRYSNIHLL